MSSIPFGFGLAHRLDSPSSGLVLIAGTRGGLTSLQAQLGMETLRREYVVVVEGAAILQ